MLAKLRGKSRLEHRGPYQRASIGTQPGSGTPLIVVWLGAELHVITACHICRAGWATFCWRAFCRLLSLSSLCLRVLLICIQILARCQEFRAQQHPETET